MFVIVEYCLSGLMLTVSSERGTEDGSSADIWTSDVCVTVQPASSSRLEAQGTAAGSSYHHRQDSIIDI